MSKENNSEDKAKSRAPPRPFPYHTLEEALAVANALENKNAGKPWKPILLGNALGIKSGSTNFRDITSSSNKYGLTIGSWQSDFISLSPLGASLTKTTKAEKEIKNRQEAILKIDVFNKIFDYYRDKKLPSPNDHFFKNMVETEFGIPTLLVDEYIRLLIENGKYSKILQEIQGSLCVIFSETPPEAGEPQKPQGTKSTTSEATPPAEKSILPIPEPTQVLPKANQIFVIHGKNKTPLEQLKKILDDPFKVPYKVAVDEANAGRPVSQKVADLMKACSSAIVILTADEEYTDSKGNKILRPSDNAVYEFGAASVLYGNKIVLLKEQGVALESDFNDLGHITFEKDRLDSKTSDILRELLGFGLLKLVTA